MPQIAIIADDLTGAADTGAYFGEVGLVAMVALTPDRRYPPGDVLAVSTESRHLTRDEATIQAQRAARRIAAECEASWVYKKIDSTLRGYPGPELEAAMDALRLEQALVAPAFPAQGRTTLGGRQRVNGGVGGYDLLALFRDTAGGRPVQGLGLDVVRRGLAAVCAALNASAGAILIADAETDADLATLARAAVTCGLKLLCGSAGLARALADVLPPLSAAPTPPLSSLATGPVLVVAGSRHPCIARQVEFARQRGAEILQPVPAFLDADDQAVEAFTHAVTERLAGGHHVILTTAGLADSALGEMRTAAQLSRVVRASVVSGRLGGLVLTGGDIAAAACSALEATTLWLCGEVQPGIAWGVLLDGTLPGLPIVTKAGGFGSDDALESAINHLAQRLSARWP